MDWEMLFGAAAAAAMLICYVLQCPSLVAVLAFACGCLGLAMYGFLRGAWPFGCLEVVWAGLAIRRWWLHAQVTQLG